MHPILLGLLCLACGFVGSVFGILGLALCMAARNADRQVGL